ncbi:hypothetical protein ACJX0J_016515, partial [Zea mays]
TSLLFFFTSPLDQIINLNRDRKRIIIYRRKGSRKRLLINWLVNLRFNLVIIVGGIDHGHECQNLLYGRRVRRNDVCTKNEKKTFGIQNLPKNWMLYCLNL